MAACTPQGAAAGEEDQRQRVHGAQIHPPTDLHTVFGATQNSIAAPNTKS